MFELTRSLLEAAVFLGAVLLWRRLAPKKLGRLSRIALLVLLFCAAFLSASFAGTYIPKRVVTLTALNEKSAAAKAAQIYLKGYEAGGKSYAVLQQTSGHWTVKGETLCWYEETDERREAGTTDSISFELDYASGTKLLFLGNEWKGKVEIRTEEGAQIVDTYRKDEGTVEAALQRPGAEVCARVILLPTAAFFLCFFALSAVSLCVVIAGGRFAWCTLERNKERPLIKKALNYRFLFEELVSRDFKKKYKRTLLGMVWSILSPLLTLLIMRLVFTRFFGRNTAHYTIYLFCGTLLFNYFSESTGQGMQSLVGNAGIFSKVNVPKYLFLFSKNVQTLINFGLTLIVFLVFCMIDRITFTWRFVLLLYPIVTIVLFNLGVGLILSALFVFFKDIQYLWTIFTQLLMYLSAIFYTIDQYSNRVQYLFFLNPLYLHIRYFRKIVIEATIPSPTFHLLMLFDALLALRIGFWMYKHYNQRFLYYI